MTISGVGTVTPVADPNADCGVSPCTWWDDIYTRQACANWLATCDPTSVLIGPTQTEGAIAGSGTLLGGAFGQAVSNFGGSFFENPDGTINWATIALIVAVGVVAVDYFAHRR